MTLWRLSCGGYKYPMPEEITTPQTIARREHFRYLGALYRLGMHDTMLMMKNGNEAYEFCSDPDPLRFL